jgi:uncharacterized protein (TIGR02246 family)
MLPANGTAAETEIRTLIEARTKAVRAKAVDAAMSAIAPGIVAFDVVNPLQHLGQQGVRQRAEQWFSSLAGTIGYELRDLAITADEDIAFSHSLNHVNATTTTGKKIDMWWRATVCYRKIDGKWKIIHEHSSVPFDPGTGKASLDLRP